jgi:putative FmdB family regulatory protein
MPLYEYRCRECGEDFEQLVRLSEANTQQECPKCHSRHTEKQLSTFAMSGGSTGSSFSGSCGSSGGFS